MTNEFISIQEASEISKKSVQTIRRAIKSKKLKIRKKKTPQGFNYLVGKSALLKIYKISEPRSVKEEAVAQPKATKAKKETVEKNMTIETDDFRELVGCMNSLVSKHTEERDNFLRLINTMQEKIFVLENKLNLLQTPQSKWYQFWK
ncbi:MAG: hypothetical protein O3B47_00900 [bacterium]|nr:hypothetical protein [bacterium]